jgi:hypothetical protein
LLLWLSSWAVTWKNSHWAINFHWSEGRSITFSWHMTGTGTQTKATWPRLRPQCTGTEKSNQHNQTHETMWPNISKHDYCKWTSGGFLLVPKLARWKDSNQWVGSWVLKFWSYPRVDRRQLLVVPSVWSNKMLSRLSFPAHPTASKSSKNLAVKASKYPKTEQWWEPVSCLHSNLSGAHGVTVLVSVQWIATTTRWLSQHVTPLVACEWGELKAVRSPAKAVRSILWRFPDTPLEKVRQNACVLPMVSWLLVATNTTKLCSSKSSWNPALLKQTLQYAATRCGCIAKCLKLALALKNMFSSGVA